MYAGTTRQKLHRGGKTTHRSGITNNGMGCDIADYNNDGLPDIVTSWTWSAGTSEMNMGCHEHREEFWRSVQFGHYLCAHVQHAAQLNNGNGLLSGQVGN